MQLFADHFEDLLEEKAKHLNISTEKLKRELEHGNQSPLTWLLATTPALYATYRQWQAPQSHDGGMPSSDRSLPSASAP